MYLKPGRLIFLGVLILIVTGFQNKLYVKDKKEFPKPDKINNLLFYVQRTININTIIYELNLNEKQELNINDPIKMYWIDYAIDGKIEPLNYIQKKYAYGLDIKMIDSQKKSFCFNFVSYKKKPIYLVRSGVDNKYSAYCEINKKLIIIKRIFIQIEGGSFWVPKIKYVEVSGKDFSKNEDVVERIIP
jgi:hypothetical protein